MKPFGHTSQFFAWQTFRKSVLLGLASTLVLGGQVAVAQTSESMQLEETEDRGLMLEEVIVTARKREESIQDAPVAVTSVAQALQRATIRKIEDLQDFAPNVYFRTTSGTPGGLSGSIRGVQYAETDKTFDSPIGVIADGMFLGTSSGSMLQNFDIKRIEVLRGPQGTLFGKNTTGGVINVVRGDVTMDWGGKASVNAGTQGRLDFKGVLNMPIIKDQLGVKLFVSRIHSNGYIYNTTIEEDVLGDNYTTYGAAIRWEPNEDFDIQFHYERYQDKTDTGAWANGNEPTETVCALESVRDWVGCGVTDTGSSRDTVSTNGRNRNDSHTDSFILNASWDVGSVLLSSITAYRDVDEHNFSEFDSSPAPFLGIDYFNIWKQFSQELRATSQFSDKFEFIAGLYYWDAEYQQRWDVGELWYALRTGLPPGTLRRAGQNQETTSWAAFFSADWHFLDRWTLTIGGRYTEEKKDFSGANGEFYLPPAPIPDIPGTTAGTMLRQFADRWNAFTPKVGVRYQHNDDLMIYASYTKGFKSGGYFGRQADFDVAIDFDYDPEFVETYELSMKSTWMDGRLTFNPVVFLSDYKDKQEAVPVFISLTSVPTAVRNVAEVKIFGIELEARFQISEFWNVRASYGYLDADYKAYIADVSGDGVETDNAHLTPINTPKNTLNINTAYVLPWGEGNLEAYLSYRWRDDIHGDTENDPRAFQKSIGNLSATLGYSWADGRYRVSFYGRNITDEREYNTQFISLYARRQWNEGATYGVEITASF